MSWEYLANTKWDALYHKQFEHDDYERIPEYNFCDDCFEEVRPLYFVEGVEHYTEDTHSVLVCILCKGCLRKNMNKFDCPVYDRDMAGQTRLSHAKAKEKVMEEDERMFGFKPSNTKKFQWNMNPPTYEGFTLDELDTVNVCRRPFPCRCEKCDDGLRY